MKPYTPGESLYNIIQTSIPDFVEADYPLFVEFASTFARFLETKRTFANTSISTEYGSVANGIVQTTVADGGSSYEARKLLEYRDAASTLDEFTSHFLAMYAKSFPRHTHVTTDLLISSLREFYRAKGTTDSVVWFFRTVFNEDADVYFPREDILKASDGTWVAPITIKVSSPIENPFTFVTNPNSDVALFYVGQRIETATGSAQVENVVTTVVGQSYNQNIIVNELTLKFDTVLGTFAPGQTLHNIDSDAQVYTTILPVLNGVIVASGGSNYVTGDIVTVSEGPTGGAGYGASGIVAATAATALNGVDIVDGGDGYITGLPVAFTSTSGSGATGVVNQVVYGEILLEDESGYLAIEDDSTGSGHIELEDKNTILLELIIDPFVNNNVAINAADYGISSGDMEIDGVSLDSAIEIVLAAGTEVPFMHPWVFTDALHSNAELANAAAGFALTCNVANFANGIVVFALSTPQDLVTNAINATLSANVIVSDITSNTAVNTLYLKQCANLSSFAVGQTWKQSGTGSVQAGTVSTDGTATVVGNNTNFSILTPNTHVRFSDGTQAVVRSVANATVLTTFAPVGVTLVANTYAVVPVGKIVSIVPQAQRFYGKIKNIQLLTSGDHYLTPPFVSSISMSGDAQHLYFLQPDLSGNIANGTIVASDGQINVYRVASLQALQDAGQITSVKILTSGVNYTDANAIQITAAHSLGSGKAATFFPVLGALTQYPGAYTTSQGWLSSDKFLQDADFYNDYTYVVRVAESFDRYKDLLLKLMHPAGFQALGQFVESDRIQLDACVASDTLTIS